MKDNLTKFVEEASKLCHDCGYEEQGTWFDQRILELSDPQKQLGALQAIDRSLAGMGSFSDLPLAPPSDYPLTKQALRTRQWELVELISEAITNHAEQGSGGNR